MSKKSQTKFPLWLFAVIFVVASLLPFITKKLSPARASLTIRDNPGASSLITQGTNLVAVFQNGKVAAWDWNNPSSEPLWQFSADSDRLVMLDDTRAAAVTKTGRKILIIYDVNQGKKFSEISVGWEDQDVWLLQSPDRKVLALARINPDKDGHTLYEFMIFNIEKNNHGFPISVDVPTTEKRLVAFAVSNEKKMFAAGSVGKHGWLIAVDLTEGKVVLEKEYGQADEFTSTVFTPDNSQAFLTNHNGSVYGIDALSGQVKSVCTVLKPGEKNIVTNDGSSQNITLSANGQYVAAVMIEQKVAVWDIQTEKPVFQANPSHKLTGSIALSPDGSLLATSDKRASGVIQIWQVKK
jgi:WD40 repeat protein